MNEIEYHLLWLKHHETWGYSIRYSGDTDGVWINDNQKIPLFLIKESLYEFVKNQKIVLKQEKPVLYDIDIVGYWLSEPNQAIDYKEFLAFWNLLDDLNRSLKTDDSGDPQPQKNRSLYAKLFWGNHLPTKTRKDKTFKPQWNDVEIAALGVVFREGMEFLDNHLEWLR